MVRAEGNPASRVMVIADAPGATELEEGRALVGSNGTMLWGPLLKLGGVARHECYATHVVQAEPMGKKGNPLASQVVAESERLEAELRGSSAEVVLLMGKVALQAVTGITKPIGTMNAYILKPEHCRNVVRSRRVQVGVYASSRKGMYTKGDPKFASRRIGSPPVLPPNCRYLVPVIPPENVRRAAFATTPALWAGLVRLGQALNGAVELIDTVPYQRSLAGIAEEVVAWDIESDILTDTITTLGVSDGNLTFTGPITAEVAAYVRRMLTTPTVVIICHNAAFDIPRLCKLVGLSIDEIRARIEDTMLGAQLVCPDLPKGLEKAAPLYLPITPWKDSSGDDPDGYNAKDAYATLHLRNKMLPELGKQLDSYRAICEAMPSLWKATQRGIRIDPEAVKAWRVRLANRVGELMGTWPFPDVNLNAPPQLVQLLYFRLKLPKKYGDEGRLSTDKGALQELLMDAPDHAPLIQHIIDFRESAIALRNWGDALRGDRIHPSFVPASKEEEGMGKGQGSSTGRFQSRDPNIMNIPEDSRNLIIADEGYELGYVDWNQAEAWVEAYLFGDEALKKALLGDIHTHTSQQMGWDRTRAKNFWYGSGRGAGPFKLQKTMVAAGFHDTTVAECKEFQRAIALMFPDWARGRQRVTAVAKAQRFLENPFGRTRRWYMPGGPGLPEVVGWVIQSTVGDMLLRMYPAVDKCVSLLTPYHDAFLFQARDRSAIVAVAEAMKRPWPQIHPDFKLGVTMAVGTRWSEMEDL